MRSPTYGAKGDGVTDDTAAIQAALTAASGNGYDADSRLTAAPLPPARGRNDAPYPEPATGRSEMR